MKAVRVRWLLTAALLGGAVGAAVGGEVIGNTYISEKDGVIEVMAEGWNIKDTETADKALLVKFTPKVAIDGFRSPIMIFRFANPGGQIEPDYLLQQIRDGMVKQGAEVRPIQMRRIAGKRVMTLQYSLTTEGGKANGLFYMMQGEKSLYWANFTANVKVWERARPMFDEFMDNVKY